MQHPVAVHHVECLVIEHERLGVLLKELAIQSAHGEILPGKPQMPRRQVGVGHAGAVGGELRQIGADPAANLQHLLSLVTIELHDLRHPLRVRSVAVPLGFEKPFPGVRRRDRDVVRSCRIVVPLPLDLILVHVAGGDHAHRLHHAARPRRRHGQRRLRVRRRLDRSRFAPEVRGKIGRNRRAGGESPQVGDVALPGIMVLRGLTRISTEGAAQIRVFRKGDDTPDELFDVAGRTEDRTLARHGGPVRRFVRRQGRRQHLTNLFEVARHDPAAERHVFEHLRRRPEELAVDHVGAVRRDIDVARLEQTRTLDLRHAPRVPDARFQAERLHGAIHEVLELTVADQQELRPRSFAAHARDRLAQHIDAVPAAERSGEADHAVVRVESQLAPDRFALARRRRRVRLGIDAVRVHQDPGRVDTARHQVGADFGRHHADERRLFECQRFRLEVLGLVHVPAAFEAAFDRHFRSVVFDDVGHAEFGAEQRAGGVSEAQALVNVGRRPLTKRRPQQIQVVRRGRRDVVLVARVARPRHDDLPHAIVVEQRKPVRHETDKGLRYRGQLLRHITGVAVAAARHDGGPEVGPEVHAAAANRMLRIGNVLEPGKGNRLRRLASLAQRPDTFRVPDHRGLYRCRVPWFSRRAGGLDRRRCGFVRSNRNQALHPPRDPSRHLARRHVTQRVADPSGNGRAAPRRFRHEPEEIEDEPVAAIACQAFEGDALDHAFLRPEDPGPAPQPERTRQPVHLPAARTAGPQFDDEPGIRIAFKRGDRVTWRDRRRRNRHDVAFAGRGKARLLKGADTAVSIDEDDPHHAWPSPAAASRPTIRSSTASATALVSINWSNGIGDGPPAAIASPNRLSSS